MLFLPTKWQDHPTDASICPCCGGPIVHKPKCKPKAPITRERANGILRSCETSFRNIFRKRWGHYLPDNERAFDCLCVLLRVIASRTDIEPDRRANLLANAASVLMPSMAQQAAERLAESIIAGPTYDPCELRGELAALLGEEIGLTAAEWSDLTLDIRNIIPPVSDAEMAVLRKQRKLARQRLRRAKKRAANPSRAPGRPKLELSDAERAERRREQWRQADRKRRGATLIKNPEASGRKSPERQQLMRPKPQPAAPACKTLANGKTTQAATPARRQTAGERTQPEVLPTMMVMLPTVPIMPRAVLVGRGFVVAITPPAWLFA